MKKKNIVKKLLSVALSATTMFSLLTLPAQAIIPGEDAYGGGSSLMLYDVDSGISTPITIPDYYSMSGGASTYSYLSSEELQNVRDAISANAVIGQDDRIPMVGSTAPYSGVVLIIQYYDTNNDGIADDYVDTSGFLVAKDVIVTSLHGLFEFSPEDTGLDDSDQPIVTLETRVYRMESYMVPAGTSKMDALNYLEGRPYDRITQVLYDNAYFTSGYDWDYDWSVCSLANGFNSYYFECMDLSVNDDGLPICAAGYPSDDRFRLNCADGNIVYAYSSIPTNLYCFTFNADIENGQSGGPVFYHQGNQIICYGIINSEVDHGTGDLTNINYARRFTSDIHNAIGHFKNPSA